MKKTATCPFCNEKVREYDCGYTTFNPVWVECKNCDIKVNGSIHNWNERMNALQSKIPPDPAKRMVTDALARLLSEDELIKLFAGPSLYK